MRLTADLTDLHHKGRGWRLDNPRRSSCPYGSLRGLSVRTGVSIWWARGLEPRSGERPSTLRM